MTIKERNWKRGVLFVCIILIKYHFDTYYLDVKEVLMQSCIEKREIKPILKKYEESKDIKFLEWIFDEAIREREKKVKEE